MSREIARRLAKLEVRKSPVRPIKWVDLRDDLGTTDTGAPCGAIIHLGVSPRDQVPPAAEWVRGLGWALLGERSRAKFAAEGRLGWPPEVNR